MMRVDDAPGGVAEGMEARFFEWSLDMLAVADFGGYFIRLNASWERTLGWTIEELKASPFMAFVHPEDRTATLEQSRRITEDSEDCLSFVNRYRTKAGAYRWLHWTARPVVSELRIYAIARDITEQKEAERALAESEERLRLALRAARMGIWEWDSVRGTVKITQGVERLMGLDRGGDEWPLDQFLRCLHPEDLLQGQRLVGKARGDFDWTFRVQRQEGGALRLHTQGRAVADLHGHPVRALGTLRCLEEREEDRSSGLPNGPSSPPNSST